jgi:hypothetical protein
LARVYNSNGLADALFCSSSSYLVLLPPTHLSHCKCCATTIFFLPCCCCIDITLGTSILKKLLLSVLDWRGEPSSTTTHQPPHLVSWPRTTAVQLSSLFWSSRRKKKKNQNFEKIYLTRAALLLFLCCCCFLHNSDGKNCVRRSRASPLGDFFSFLQVYAIYIQQY